MPDLEYGDKGLRRCGQRGDFGLQTVDARVYASGDLCAQVVALLPRGFQRHHGIRPQRNALLLVLPCEAEMPFLRTLAADEQQQPVRLGEGVVFAGSFGLPDNGVGQCHEGALL